MTRSLTVWRDGAAAGLGVSPTNTFRLLAGLGAELAGALSLLPEGEEPSDAESVPAPEAFSDDELAGLLALQCGCSRQELQPPPATGR